MTSSWKLRPYTHHSKHFFNSLSLAQTHLTSVVGDGGQRDVFTVPGALDHVLFLHLPHGHSPGGLLMLCSPFARAAELCSVLFTWRSCRSPSLPLPPRLSLSKTLVAAWPQICLLFRSSLLFLAAMMSLSPFPLPKRSIDLFPALAQILVSVCDSPVFPGRAVLSGR